MSEARAPSLLMPKDDNPSFSDAELEKILTFLIEEIEKSGKQLEGQRTWSLEYRAAVFLAALLLAFLLLGLETIFMLTLVHKSETNTLAPYMTFVLFLLNLYASPHALEYFLEQWWSKPNIRSASEWQAVPSLVSNRLLEQVTSENTEMHLLLIRIKTASDELKRDQTPASAHTNHNVLYSALSSMRTFAHSHHGLFVSIAKHSIIQLDESESDEALAIDTERLPLLKSIVKPRATGKD